MMKSRNLVVTLSAGLFALTVAAAGFGASQGPHGGNEVHVVNSYGTPVAVHVEDADSRLHYLGRVLASTVKRMAVGEDIAAKGKFRIKIYPETAAWNGLGADGGIRSGDVSLRDGEMVCFFMERDLSDSGVLVTPG
jgi:hypothetical protein